MILVVEKIKAALESVQPFILSHGGKIELVKVENNVVFVSLHGGCIDCPASMYTVQIGLKQAFQAAVPEIVDVVIVE